MQEILLDLLWKAITAAITGAAAEGGRRVLVWWWLRKRGRPPITTLSFAERKAKEVRDRLNNLDERKVKPCC